ncbi:MAG: flagellar hook-associated protein FlgK, partial [Bacteroidota bacterium]
MTSLFGFSIATSGLAAQQRALETISHNIANANTPGFSRQSTAITSAEPMKVSGRRAGMVGTGANATTISRQRNGFLDLQYRNENTKLAENQTLADTLAKVEGVFGEPSESGLRTMTERYWTAWQDLSLNPESIAARGSVAEAGQALATSLNSVASNIQQYREDHNLRVKNTVTDINILSSQIASLNKQISAITSLGQQPNDLKDQRDLAVDKLSALVEVRTQDNEDGSIKVTAAGRVLVEGAESVPMGTELKGTEGFVDITSYG